MYYYEVDLYIYISFMDFIQSLTHFIEGKRHVNLAIWLVKNQSIRGIPVLWKE